MPRSAIRMIAYSNPLVVISALAVVLQFNNMNIGTNKVINFIAASAFGVYLLHDNIFTVHQIYVPMMKYLGSTYGWLAIAGAMIAVFAVAVLLDQPRKIMWKHISGKCFTKK